jgi:hypothetical protein
MGSFFIEENIFWLGITISIYSIVLCLAGAYVSYRKNLIIYSLYCLMFMVLTAFQSLLIAFDFNVIDSPLYLEHSISLKGYSEALLYLAFTSTFFYLVPLLNKKIVFEYIYRKRVFVLNKGMYCFLYVYCVILSLYLVFVVVGLDVYMQSSRPGFIAGSTIILVGLLPGLLPIIFRYMYGDRATILDWGLYFFVVGFTFTFSRIHAIAYIIILAFTHTVNVYRGLPQSNKGLPRISRYLFGFLALAFIALLIGAVRDALNYTDAGFPQIYDYLSNNLEFSLLSIDRNYRIGIEAMSSLAGAMSTGQGGVVGSPIIAFSLLIRGFFQILPGGLKPFFCFIIDDMENLYWYKASVLPPGIESAYLSFGYFGTLIFPLILNALCVVGTNVIAKGRYGPWTRLLSILMLMNLVFYIRGSWIVWIAFNISYFLIFILFFEFLFKYSFKKKFN